MKEPKFSEALKTMQIIHWTVTLAPVAFSLVILTLGAAGDAPALKDTFLYISLIMLLVAVPISSLIFKIYLKKNGPKNKESVRELFGPYQTAHLLRLSILEITGFFALMGAFTTGYLPLLGIVLVSTAVMISHTPTAFKISQIFGVNINDLDAAD